VYKRQGILVFIETDNFGPGRVIGAAC
jgi:hypothetical protein